MAAAFGRALCRRGFEQVRPRRWVRSDKAPIRELFEVFATKASYVPAWGFSADYVPHVAGSSVRWHRTAKSALFDVWYSPLYYGWQCWGPLERLWMMCGVEGEIRLELDALKLRHVALPMAHRFWGRVATVQDFRNAIQRMRVVVPASGFGEDPQQVLAYAFTLARLGDPVGAAAELQRYVVETGPSDACQARLQELPGQAAATPG